MTDYDPTIRALIDQCAADWGDPIKNRAGLIPYGIEPLDRALYGIDSQGELVVIQGKEKNGKTRFAANVICNFMTYEKLKVKPVTNIDTLESGMRPQKYRDLLISIMATRFLFAQGHRYQERCPVCDDNICHELGINSKYLRYNTRSEIQRIAIEYAQDIIRSWPLLIHGAGIHTGNTRNLHEAAISDRQAKARWVRLIEDYGLQIQVVDHVQQYAFDGEPSDYEKLLRAISAMGDFVSQYGVALLAISQVSLTSIREARTTGGTLIAAGGSKAAQEANTVLTTDYDGGGRFKISIEESRDAGSFPIWMHMEDVSGCLYGEPSINDPFLEDDSKRQVKQRK